MRVHELKVARRFKVGGIELSHAGDIELDADELVTFTAASGSELDVTRKSWGYYATPSLNGRLREHGLRAALAAGGEPARMYLLLVEDGEEQAFNDYLASEGMRVVAWLDSDAAVAEAERRLR